MPALEDSVDGGHGVSLELRHAIDLAWVGDVQQVMGDKGLLRRSHLGRADIQAPVDLARIG